MDQGLAASIENCAPTVGNLQLLLTLLEQFAFIDRLVVLNQFINLVTWSSKEIRKR